MTRVSNFQSVMKAQESELTIRIAFFRLTRISKPLFPTTSSFPEILCEKSNKDNKYTCISITITLCLMKFLSFL